MLHVSSCYTRQIFFKPYKNGGPGLYITFAVKRVMGFSPVYHAYDCISDAMVSVFASSVVGHGFKPRSGQAKTIKCGIAASPLGM